MCHKYTALLPASSACTQTHCPHILHARRHDTCAYMYTALLLALCACTWTCCLYLWVRRSHRLSHSSVPFTQGDLEYKQGGSPSKFSQVHFVAMAGPFLGCVHYSEGTYQSSRQGWGNRQAGTDATLASGAASMRKALFHFPLLSIYTGACTLIGLAPLILLCHTGVTRLTG